MLDFVDRPYKCLKTSDFLTSTWFLLTSCSVDNYSFYAMSDPFQREPEFNTSRKFLTCQTAIRLPSFLGAGNAPDLHKRQTVERDTPSSISTTGRRTKAWSGRPLKLRRGSGRVGADALRLRGTFTWLAVTACSFSFMDELQVCATDQRDVRCIQPSGFTVFFPNVVQLLAKPRQCLLCGP